MNSIEQRLKKMLLKLAYKELPFMGSFLLGFSFEEGIAKPGQINTMAVDFAFQHFVYYPSFIAQLTDSQLLASIAHEALHIALKHYSRKGNRDAVIIVAGPDGNPCPVTLWNLSADIEVNALLYFDHRMDIVRSPEEEKTLEKYKGWPAEKIYEDLRKNIDKIVIHGLCGKCKAQSNEKGQSGQGQGSGKENEDGQGSGSGDDEIHVSVGSLIEGNKQPDNGIETVEGIVSKEAEEYFKRQGTQKGHWYSIIKFLNIAKLDWRTMLWRACSTILGSGYRSWRRINHRRFAQYEVMKHHKIIDVPKNQPIVFPIEETMTSTIALMVDSSGSMSDRELQAIFAELHKIRATYGKVRIHLIVCDWDIQQYKVYEHDEPIETKVKFKGRGGTSFKPMFEFIEKENLTMELDLAIIFTDGYGDWPKKAPTYPVVGLFTTKDGMLGAPKWVEKIYYHIGKV